MEQKSFLEDGERFLLAQIYERQSRAADDDQGRSERLQAMADQLRSLCTRPNPQPQHLRALLSYLLEQADGLNEADKWLKELERVAQNELRHAEPARPLAQSEQTFRGDSAPHVEKFVDRVKAEAKTDSQLARLYLVAASILRGVDLAEKAEKWSRDAMKLDPQAYTAVAQDLIAQGEKRQAVELCQSVCEKTPTSRAAEVLATILVAVQADDELVKCSEPLLDKMLASPERSAQLLMTVANLRIMQKRAADAIKLYEQALNDNPRSAVTLNNLASLLAEQPGRSDEALKHIDRALAIVGRSPALLDTKATIYFHAGRAKKRRRCSRKPPLATWSTRGTGCTWRWR